MEINESVRIDRPVSQVFRAWTSGPRLSGWFAPMTVRPPAVQMDFREGGEFRIEMDLGPGGIHRTVGRFLEIDADQRIRMTWHCDAWNDPPSEVEVLFVADGEATVVRVRHTRITSAPAHEGQRAGWSACLQGLVAVLTGHEPGAER